MDNLIESIEYKPNLPLDNKKARSMKIVFQNKMKLQTNTGDSYNTDCLYITWGKYANDAAQDRDQGGVDSWLEYKNKRTTISVTGMKTISKQHGAAPIEVLHGIIIATYESDKRPDESTHESGDTVDETGQSLIDRMYERVRELLS